MTQNFKTQILQHNCPHRWTTALLINPVPTTATSYFQGTILRRSVECQCQLRIHYIGTKLQS